PWSLSSLLIFFQAEDGIRDFHVTGVQTCALPIYLPRRWLRGRYAVPASEPDPVGFGDMSQRVEHRGETAAQVARKLFGGECGGGVEDGAVRPVGVAEQPLELGCSDDAAHASSLNCVPRRCDLRRRGTC